MAYTMYTIEMISYEEIIHCYNHDTSSDIDGSAKIICHVYLYTKVYYKRTTRKHRIKLKKIVDRLADYKELEDLNE